MNRYFFHTYKTNDGEDQIILIKAASHVDAIAEFDFIYGEHTPVYMIVEAIPPFNTRKVGPMNTTYLDFDFE